MPSRIAARAWPYIPQRAGILVINSGGRVFEIAKPIVNDSARAATDKERYDLARLGALRIWDLKREIEDKKHHIELLKEESKYFEEMAGGE